MNVQQFRDSIVAPVLRRLEMHSAAAEEQMIATAVHESEGLQFIRQVGGGPAVSYFQIEPQTAQDVVDRYFRKRPDIAERFSRAVMWDAHWNDRIVERLTGDQAAACAVARIRYWMAPDPLPSADDVEAMATYWKAHYQRGPNRRRGVQDFIDDYNRFAK